MKKKILCLLSVFTLSFSMTPSVYASTVDTKQTEVNTAVLENQKEELEKETEQSEQKETDVSEKEDVQNQTEADKNDGIDKNEVLTEEKEEENKEESEIPTPSRIEATLRALNGRFPVGISPDNLQRVLSGLLSVEFYDEKGNRIDMGKEVQYEIAPFDFDTNTKGEHKVVISSCGLTTEITVHLIPAKVVVLPIVPEEGREEDVFYIPVNGDTSVAAELYLVNADNPSETIKGIAGGTLSLLEFFPDLDVSKDGYYEYSLPYYDDFFGLQTTINAKICVGNPSESGDNSTGDNNEGTDTLPGDKEEGTDTTPGDKEENTENEETNTIPGDKVENPEDKENNTVPGSKVENKEENKTVKTSPKTGDTQNVLLFTFAGAASLLALGGSVALKNKKTGK